MLRSITTKQSRVRSGTYSLSTCLAGPGALKGFTMSTETKHTSGVYPCGCRWSKAHEVNGNVHYVHYCRSDCRFDNRKIGLVLTSKNGSSYTYKATT